MTTIAGSFTPGKYPDELPDELPGGQRDWIWVERGGAEDQLELYDALGAPPVVLADLVGATLWLRHIEEQVIVVASELGKHAYMLDLATWRMLQDVEIWRADESYWHRLPILATPDESRCVLLSDRMIHVLTWRGTVVYERHIYVTDRFIALGNDSYTLSDEPYGSLEFTMPFPRKPPWAD